MWLIDRAERERWSYLSAASRAGEIAHALPTYTHPAVLVVDEVGYRTYGTVANSTASGDRHMDEAVPRGDVRAETET